MKFSYKYEIIIFLLIIFLLELQIKAQDFWQITGYSSTAAINKLNVTGNNLIIAATEGNGVVISKDSGTTWETRNTGITELNIKSICSKNDSILLAGIGNRKIYVSTDTGYTWTQYNMFGTGSIITSFFVMPDGKIFAGQLGDGIFRTTNNGATWNEVGLCCAGVLSIVANSGGVIFAGTNAGGVARSTNGGFAWDYVNTGLSNYKINTLAVNKNNVLFAGTNGGIFRSDNNGDSWTEINYGITNLIITNISIKSNGHIFASTNGGGVFLSKDNGDTWNPVNTGLANMNVLCIAMDSSGFVYAACSDSTLYRSIIPYSNINNIFLASSLKLEQNFPNPFSNSTNVKFYVPETSYVTLKIFDMSGVYMETLINKKLSQGWYYKIWDASEKLSGLYICELRMNENISKIIMNFVK